MTTEPPSSFDGIVALLTQTVDFVDVCLQPVGHRFGNHALRVRHTAIVEQPPVAELLPFRFGRRLDGGQYGGLFV